MKILGGLSRKFQSGEILKYFASPLLAGFPLTLKRFKYVDSSRKAASQRF